MEEQVYRDILDFPVPQQFKYLKVIDGVCGID